MRVVVDASPVIALSHIGRLNILRDLYGSVVIPDSVRRELLAGEGRHPTSDELAGAEWIVAEPDPTDMALRKELGAGETAAIVLAYKTKADLVILEDLQARLVADGLGLAITGTLGVLVAAYKKGMIADLSAALADLQTTGFRISPKLLTVLQATSTERTR